MPLFIIRDDITKLEFDAIVNTTNEYFIYGGFSVDSQINLKAGEDLQKELQQFLPISISECVITKGYNLPCKNIIHTVGPVFETGDIKEIDQLKRCYTNALDLASRNDIKTIAFPLISSGTYMFPKGEALNIATSAIRDYLLKFSSDIDVYLVVFDGESYSLSRKLFGNIEEYIDDNYMGGIESISLQSSTFEDTSETLEKQHRINKNNRQILAQDKAPRFSLKKLEAKPVEDKCGSVSKNAVTSVNANDFSQMLDESYSDMLIRLIDRSGMTDAQCYNKANISRNLFGKIKNQEGYHTKKQVLLAFAIALQLDIKETEELLLKAGYALSPSSLFDVIVKYYITIKEYDIDKINIVLFEKDQPLLGSQ